MKKILTLIILSVFCLNAINAEVTWTLSEDSTLTISGTDMPEFLYIDSAPWFSQRGKVKKVIIKNGVTSIGNNAFCYCERLTSVTIPNSVSSIGHNAFKGCHLLTSITIPNSVTGIGSSAFSECSGLTSVIIPNSVSSIGGYTFERCSSLTSITISNSVMSIGESAFYNCSSLTSITIPNSVTSIGNKAFEGCNSLFSITIPNSVTSIGESAFMNCYNLTSIVIPNSVTKISYQVFFGCYNLLSITIPNSVTSIAPRTFGGCTGLTSITIPETVTSIESQAFYGCIGLTSITIPNSVTSIGTQAFEGCTGLTSITIPKSVTSIGDQPFSGCSALTSIIVEQGNKMYDSRNDCNAIIKTESNSLICGCENTVIPKSVTSIGSHAFYGCTGLTSINIPNSVTSVGGYAFYGCSNLTSITIPENVTSINIYAFYGAKLRNIVIKAKTPPSGFGDDSKGSYSTFSKQSYYHTTLLIPEGSWDAYAYSDNWYQFINIREMVYKTANLTNSKAYMMKSETEGSYLFYDSVNDCVGKLNENALDDTEENNTWMTVEVEGKHYVYNLGAKKFLVSGKTDSGYGLSDSPSSIDIEDGKEAIVFGKSKEFYMVINDKLNVVEELESQISLTTGIKSPSVEANKPSGTYNVNGMMIPDNAKGLYIRNGKKVLIK